MDTYLHFLKKGSDLAIATAMVLPPLHYVTNWVTDNVSQAVADAILNNEE